MQHRRLGRSGLRCAPLVLGCHVFGWTVNEATSHTILDAFTDRGFALIDTADTYSTWVPGHQGGEFESIIGNWLKATGKRDQVLIATKVGGDMKNVGKGLSRAHIIRSAEDSLRRLRCDWIDLYQAHFDDTAVSFEETLEAFASLSLDILGELDRAALHFNATPAQIAIAWLLAQPGITAPIVSVTSPAQLTEIFGATTMTLDARTLMRLDLVSA